MKVQETRRGMLRGALPAVLLAALILAICLPAWGAAEPGATTMAVDPSLSPVEARRLRFLFWAYAAIWTLLGGYLVSLGFRLRAVRAEIGRVRARLEASRPRNGPA